MMKTGDFANLIFLFIFSLILATRVQKQNIITFLTMLPSIHGILLGGILASLAIIFGIMGSKDLALIYNRSIKYKNRDVYRDFLRQTEIDAKIIFSTLISSILLLIFYDINLGINYLPEWLFLGLGFFGLSISILSVYEIIVSLFYLNELRYELSTKIEIGDE
jgi:hypothetical protein